MRFHLTRHRATRAFAVLAVLAGMMSFSEPASAIHDEGFALQGDVHTAGSTPLDWEDFFNADGTKKALPAGGYLASSFKPDYAEPDASAYATGSKDTLPINVAGQGDWQCKSSNNIGSKFNLLNAYAAALRPTSGTDANDLIIYFGSEIGSPNGDRNTGVWLLQDDDVGCSSAGGGNTDWAGHHTDGDVFIVSAFTGGGTEANIIVYEWNDTSPGDNNADIGGELVLHDSFTDATCPPGTADDACAIVNSAAEVDPPWPAPDADGGNLNINEFFEGGINLTDLDLDVCFSTVVFNSRSAPSPGSNLHDFTSDDFETCGNMTVRKYIDVDMSGTNNTGDVTTGAPVASWAFTVTRNSDSTVVCSGSTTSTAGALTCTTGSLTNLLPGSYTITETQKTGFFNTDPGPADDPLTTTVDESLTNFLPGATVSKTVNVGFGNTVVELGNTCYVDKTFQINNVPTGTGAISVEYVITAGPGSGATVYTVPLTGTTTRSATVNDTLVQTNSITWRWYLDSDSANKVTGATGESLASGAYPTCAKTNQANFPFVTISGSKYKDIDADGVGPEADPDGAGPLIAEFPLAGFDFNLMQGTTQIGSTAISAADGTFSFTNVAPGTYTVVELAETGWLQTEPVSGTGINVTVTLASSATVNLSREFGNAPLSNIDVNFEAQTAFTDSTISCTGPAQPTGGTAISGSQTDGSYSSDGLIVGSYVCTIVIVDP